MFSGTFIFLLWGISASLAKMFEEQATSFEDRMTRTIDNRRMGEERLQDVEHVLKEIEDVLTGDWPGSRVVVYGSIPPRLATVDSDIDCSVLIPNVGNTARILYPNVTETLLRHPHLFANFVIFPTQAETPVIKFRHIPTQFNVDLTINNLNSVQTSKLLKYLLQNKTLYKLAFTVKLWAQTHGITCSGKLPNYGLILMVVFYLQQRNLLPPVAMLQTNVNPAAYGEWNVAFRELEYKTNVTTPLNSLLEEFFLYYDQFDYSRYIINPHSGYPIEKRHYSENSTSISDTIYSKNVKSNLTSPLLLDTLIVIQDLFLLNNNIAKDIDIYCYSNFIEQVHYAAKSFKQNNEDFLALS